MKRLIFPILMILLVTSTAHGFGGLFRRTTTSGYSSYYGGPIYVSPVPQYYYAFPPQPYYVQPYEQPIPQQYVPPMMPATSLPTTPPIVVPGMATPRSAPPSLTPEPAESSTSMRVSTKYYDLVPTVKGTVKGDGYSVAFWNLTGRTLTVNVNGEDRTLGNGQSVTFDLPRSFRWQVSGRGVETMQLAASEKGAEILIRK